MEISRLWKIMAMSLAGKEGRRIYPIVWNSSLIYLVRLKSRHIQFIALGGTIGTGLFLGIGRAFTQAGPLSLLLGYTLTGIAVYAMMQCLGEMATWLPLPGAIPQFCARYVDGSMGFAVGWNVSIASSCDSKIP